MRFDPSITALVIALLLNSGGMFYWGGAVRTMLREQDRRILNLEKKVGIAV